MTRRCMRRGYTLKDMIVAIFVTALLFALFLPMATSPRINCRRTQCQNNLKNIALALVQYSTAHNVFPQAGTFFDDPDAHQGDPLRSNIYKAVVSPSAFAGDPGPCRANWVVSVLPYLDQQDLYDAWSSQKSYLSTETKDPTEPSNGLIASTALGILRCPDDRTYQSVRGDLSYAVNGGFVRWQAVPVGWDAGSPGSQPGNGGMLRWANAGGDWRDTQGVCRKLGVMSLGTTSGDQPWDVRTRPADVVDGLSLTLMVGENTLTGASAGTPYSGGLATNWACPLPNFSMFLASDDVCRNGGSATDCLGGQLRPTPKGETGAGWAWANRPGNGEAINDTRGRTVEGSFPFASSGHPGVANFAFCDGSVKSLSATIDGSVYARIITPAGETLPDGLRQTPVSASEVAP